MVNKVDELTQNATSDFDKAINILNWVHKSKNYCLDSLLEQGVCHSGTNAQPQDTYQEIFDSEYGVCMDASFVATSMLRRAGISSTVMIIGAFHIVTSFNIDGDWYVADPTFCIDKNQCSDVTIIKVDQNSGRIILYYGDSKAMFIDAATNKYCDMSNLCFDVRLNSWSNKIMLFDNESAEIFIPNAQTFNNKYGTQYNCGFAFGDLVCDYYGCGYFYGVAASPENVIHWEYLFGANAYWVNSSEIYYGYKYARIPANKYYKYECYEWYRGHPDAKLISLNYIKPEKNSLISITPDKLKRADNASLQMFNELKKLISQSVQGIDLNAIILDNKP
jgi:hypothetical protein